MTPNTFTRQETPAVLYKILFKGKSCNGGDHTWSLPAKGKPGDWHEVAGPLVRCRNGFHLTDNPRYRGHADANEIYEAEYEGETLGASGDEWVCRKVRLLRLVAPRELMTPAETSALDAGEAVKRAKKQEEARYKEVERRVKEGTDSPAYVLLKHTWDNRGETGNDSWRRVNDAMGSILRTAIKAGIRFNLDDFKRFSREFNSAYWIGDGESCYAAACGRESGDHGGNMSAALAFEQWRGRKPFLVLKAPNETAKLRLCVGERFYWHLAFKAKVMVTVTSFDDAAGTLTACSHKPYEPGKPSKIDRRFTITHDDVAEYHAALKPPKKRPARLETAQA